MGDPVLNGAVFSGLGRAGMPGLPFCLRRHA